MAEPSDKIGGRARRILNAPRTRKIAIWCVSIVAAVGILGALIAPYALRRVLANQLAAQLHRPVTIEQIRINPYAMTAAVQGFRMQDPSGKQPELAFDELLINLELESLFRLGPVLKEVRLTKPYVNLVRLEDGRYNFQDLIDEFMSQPSDPAAPTPRFSLNNIELIDGRIDFDDRLERSKHQISAIRLGVPFLSSLPSQVEIKVQPSFSAVVNGAPFEIKGESIPFHESLESNLRLHIDSVQIPKYLNYSPVPLNFNVSSGILDGNLNISFRTSKQRESALAISGSMALRKLIVSEKGELPLLELPALDVALGTARLFAQTAVIKAVKAEGLQVHLRRRRDGTLNLASLTGPAPAKPGAEPPSKTPEPPFRFALEQLLLESGKLFFYDDTTPKPFQTLLDNVRIEVQGLTNEPDKKASVEISFDGDAAKRVGHKGRLQLSPLMIEGILDVKGFRPGNFKPYYQDAFLGEIRDGALDLSTQYAFKSTGQEPEIVLTGLNAALNNFRLEEHGKKALLNVASLAVKDTTVDIGNKSVVIGTLEGGQASAFIQRNSDGSLNFDRLIKQTEPRPRTEAPRKNPEPDWKIEAKQVALKRVRVDFTDQVPASGAKISITDLSLRGQGFSTAKGRPARIAIDARLNRGQVRMTGTAAISPAGARLRLEGRDIELLPLQPYLEKDVNFILTGGRAGMQGDLVVDAGQPGPVKVNYGGEITVADFAAIEKDAAADLLKWKLLALGGMQFALEPLQLRLNTVDLAGFYTRIVLGADGKINLQKLTVESEKSGPPADGAKTGTAPPAAASQPSAVTIGKINLREGNINFSDFFVKPNYSANLTDVQGVISELKPESPGDIAIEAKLDNAAPVDIRGKINPLGKDLFMDIKAKASDIELSPFSPYSGKYVGYGIEKGKLTFDVAYKIENRKLDAQTQFILNELTFGEKIDSPTAANLPVKLAVALLKDRNGVIDVGLPVSGSLDDPQFSIGGLVWRIIVNLVTRAVTAPFSLLGAAFGGGGAELSYLEFDYGRAMLPQAAQDKVKALAAAMIDRPGLKLDITGRTDPANDLDGLKRVSIENKVRAQKFKELARQGSAPQSVEAVQVGKDEYERYLRAAYGEESFPKPRNLIGFAKSIPVPEMESLMLKYARVTEEDVRELGNRRAQTVRDRLLEAKVPADRLFIVGAKPLSKEDQDKLKAKGSRVDFALR